ncbi:MAG: arginine--tRNA ligase [Dehalococcoidia bacterium]|nr:MAG: arginine--tRNA ligase [Dehalococcoidia bacterium]
MIRDEVVALVEKALATAQAAGALPEFAAPAITAEHPARPEHGDFSSNVALRIQGLARMKAIEVAEALRAHVPAHPAIEKVTVAPPGFVNFYLAPSWAAAQADAIARAGEAYPDLDLGGGRSAQIEYVSANPTGPIHVGNGRGAAIGSTLANVMTAAGYKVQQEYYINDAGTQVGIFGRTLYARYEQLHGREASVPENGYPGQYMVDVAQTIKDRFGDQYLRHPGEEADPAFGRLGIDIMVEGIRADLALMGVEYDEWYSERSLMAHGGPYDTVMAILKNQGQVVERDGATWFTSSDLGESKDNVLIRSDGAPTYYATDIAYHYDKFVTRKFDRVVDIWGADHQGHVSRVKAGVQAVGADPAALDVLLYQLVTLRRGEHIVPLSKRAGEIVTLKDVVEEVGCDATRFFFLLTGANQTMDFDLDLAKKQSDENPVYYVQYAHARIASVIAKAAAEGHTSEGADTSLLTHEAEQTLLRKLLLLPEVIEKVVLELAPHHLTHYAQELAGAFHPFYTQCRVIQADQPALTKARLRLLEATQTVLARTLGLMGISAPEQM